MVLGGGGRCKIDEEKSVKLRDCGKESGVSRSNDPFVDPGA